MFEHSVRVPRHYKVAANIFKKVSIEGGSGKTLLYDNKLRHFRTNVLFALITETVKHAADIDKIFESSEILKKEPRLDPWLAKVLTAELLFGKKSLPGISKPEQTVLAYKEQFEKYANDHQDELKNEVVKRPRYVRINTNLLTTSDAIRAFQDEGYKFTRCTSGSYNDYLQQIQGLTEYNFTQDYHVKTIFVFSHGTKLHEHDLYLENQIILQDKATAMAVHLLAPSPGSVVLDMCAAPGMKTTQVAAYMRNEGKVYAIERNEKRFQTLTDFVNKTGCKGVELIHKDALEIRRGEYDDVEYILLDPSCSGSGMEFSVHNYIEDTRLAKLTSLQEKFLKHAMNAFPKAKRIVYSTCSLFPEENERVITNVVKNSRTKWRVQDVKEMLKGQWNNFGSGMYGSMGTRCLYAKPDTDLTTGFFLAVLDRDHAELERAINGENKTINEEATFDCKSKKGKRKKNSECSEHTDTLSEDNTEIPNKKNIKEKSKHAEESNDVGNNVTYEGLAGDSSIRNQNSNYDVIEVEEASKATIEKNCHSKNKKRKHADKKELFANGQTDTSIYKEDSTIQNDTLNLKKAKNLKSEHNNDIESIKQKFNEHIFPIEKSDCKRKNKKKYKSQDNTDIELINIDINDDESIKNETNNSKKKKKKKHTSKDTIDIELINPEHNGDEFVKNQINNSKTKKHKSKYNTDIELTNQELNKGESNKNDKNNSKKKTKEKLNVKDIIEIESINPEIDEDESVKKQTSNSKKKKHKSKYKTDIESLNQELKENESIDTETGHTEKKKKFKSKEY